jgi:hypothetical protein
MTVVGGMESFNDWGRVSWDSNWNVTVDNVFWNAWWTSILGICGGVS